MFNFLIFNLILLRVLIRYFDLKTSRMTHDILGKTIYIKLINYISSIEKESTK